MTVATLTLKRPGETDQTPGLPDVEAEQPYERLTAAERMALLKLEAVTLARQEAREFIQKLEGLEAQASELIAMGDAIPAGFRDRIHTLSLRLSGEAQNLTAILSRS